MGVCLLKRWKRPIQLTYETIPPHFKKIQVLTSICVAMQYPARPAVAAMESSSWFGSRLFANNRRTLRLTSPCMLPPL